MDHNIDYGLYDRQVRTFGQQASIRINNSTVYIIGLEGGLGCEVAKNLALSGIKNIILCDKKVVTKNDIEFSYYYNDDSCGKLRTTVLKQYLQELNPMLVIEEYNDNLKTNIYKRDSVLVFANINSDEVNSINHTVRTEYNCKTVYVYSSGLGGYVFVDANKEHIVYDLAGENINPVNITKVNRDGKINCEKHQFQYGDYISFSEMKGNNLEELTQTDFRIINTDTFSFTIKLEKELSTELNFINGIANIVQKPTTFNHLSFGEQLFKIEMDINTFDYEMSEKIIQTFRICEIFKAENIMPWSDQMEDHLSTFDENIQPLVRSLGVEIGPVNSIMGGFASTEVIKLVTFKYTPVSQLLTWHDFSCLPSSKPMSSNSSHLNQLFGDEIINKLNEMNILMVGCGALGCEWLKNMSLLNVATTTGQIDVTDPDHIERSNLSRQFLFRPENVGSSKSKTAINSVLGFNHEMNMKAYENKMSNDDKDFTNKIMEDKTVIINALDNIKARRYIDGECFNRNLPLFESGTMGMKGNTQPVIPFLTETYSNSNDPEDTNEFPVCTIKNFPNSIQHTIHWARDYFELFNRGPTNVNKCINNSAFTEDLSLFEANQAKEDINHFSGRKISTWKVCANFSKEMFEKEFNHNIKQLLHCFPKDHLIDDKPFWSSGKKCPTAFETFETSQYLVDFIEATTHIYCRCFGIADSFTRSDIEDYIKTFTMNEFNVDGKKKIAKNDTELKEMATSTDSIELNGELFLQQSNPQEFEKDDDTNWHVKWITAASNCRAINYSIKPEDEYVTKGIAGKIIPAVATTTSTIVGLISFEMFKYICGNESIEDYSSWYMNMADNTSIKVEPVPAPKLKIGETDINSWTKFDYKDNTNLELLIKYYEDIFKTKISMILYDTTIIHAEFMPADLSLALSELFKNEHEIDLNKSKINLILMTEEEDIELPQITLSLC